MSKLWRSPNFFLINSIVPLCLSLLPWRPFEVTAQGACMKDISACPQAALINKPWENESDSLHYECTTPVMKICLKTDPPDCADFGFPPWNNPQVPDQNCSNKSETTCNMMRQAEDSCSKAAGKLAWYEPSATATNCNEIPSQTYTLSARRGDAQDAKDYCDSYIASSNASAISPCRVNSCSFRFFLDEYECRTISGINCIVTNDSDRDGVPDAKDRCTSSSGNPSQGDAASVYSEFSPNESNRGCDIGPAQPTIKPSFTEIASPESKNTCSGGVQNNDSVNGSQIECRDRLVKQMIPIVGTPFSLHYNSRESLGGKVANQNLVLKLSQVPLDASYGNLLRVTFHTTLLDRDFVQSFEVNAPAASITENSGIVHTVAWDGKKADGSSFFGMTAGKTVVSFEMQHDPATGTPITFENTSTRIFSAGDDLNRFNLGGWTLSPYHSFDPSVGSLSTGFGSRVVLSNAYNPADLIHDAAGNVNVPSADAAEIYVFSPTGLHLKTLDGITGVTLFTFLHDAAAHLIKITDRYGNASTLQRDPSGAILGIVSPTGEITAFTRSSQGYIDSIKDLAGRVTSFTYGIDSALGLMLSFTNARGLQKFYTYNSKGFLDMAI